MNQAQRREHLIRELLREDRKYQEIDIPEDTGAQRDLLRTGGTDGGPVHVSREGVLTGGVSIPCRYTHTPTELMDWKDFDACVRLIQAFCEEELEQL